MNRYPNQVKSDPYAYEKVREVAPERVLKARRLRIEAHQHRHDPTGLEEYHEPGLLTVTSIQDIMDKHY